MLAETDDDVYHCGRCGEPLPDDDRHIKNWKGEIMCADCIDELDKKGDWKTVLEFAGRKNIFDLLDKLHRLEWN
jgi:DNA-directed RNA polymerase subunit RPC12/RpoP